MQDDFNPYFKWLGIPPEEQPPNHYRLLAIPLFVDDPDVIESAADQRMMLLRSYQTGSRASLSQRILNEVSEAKVCLLNSERKMEYDRRLRALDPPPHSPPRKPPPAPPRQSRQDTIATRSIGQSSTRPQLSRRKSIVPTLLITGVLFGLSLVFIVWIIIFVGSQSDDPISQLGQDRNNEFVQIQNEQQIAEPDKAAKQSQERNRQQSTLRFKPISDQEIIPGAILRFTVKAEDSNGEPLGVQYRVVSGPNGARVEPFSGMFSWQTHREHANSSHEVTISAITANGVSTQSKFKANVTSQRIGEWIDILSLVDPKRDAKRGVGWKWNDEGLESYVYAPFELAIPFSLSGSYDLSVTFRKTGGEGGPVFLIPVGTRFRQVTIQSTPNAPESALETGKTYTVLLKVRIVDSEHASVVTLLNESTYSTWEGTTSSLIHLEEGQMPTITTSVPHIFTQIRLQFIDTE